MATSTINQPTQADIDKFLAEQIKLNTQKYGVAPKDAGPKRTAVEGVIDFGKDKSGAPVFARYVKGENGANDYYEQVTADGTSLAEAQKATPQKFAEYYAKPENKPWGVTSAMLSTLDGALGGAPTKAMAMANYYAGRTNSYPEELMRLQAIKEANPLSNAVNNVLGQSLTAYAGAGVAPKIAAALGPTGQFVPWLKSVAAASPELVPASVAAGGAAAVTAGYDIINRLLYGEQEPAAQPAAPAPAQVAAQPAAAPAAVVGPWASLPPAPGVVASATQGQSFGDAVLPDGEFKPADVSRLAKKAPVERMSSTGKPYYDYPNLQAIAKSHDSPETQAYFKNWSQQLGIPETDLMAAAAMNEARGGSYAVPYGMVANVQKQKRNVEGERWDTFQALVKKQVDVLRRSGLSDAEIMKQEGAIYEKVLAQIAQMQGAEPEDILTKAIEDAQQ